MTDHEMFLAAMGGKWRIERYEVQDDDRLRIHYRSLDYPLLEWSHTPHNSLAGVGKVGTVGYIGFISEESWQQQVERERQVNEGG